MFKGSFILILAFIFSLFALGFSLYTTFVLRPVVYLPATEVVSEVETASPSAAVSVEPSKATQSMAPANTKFFVPSVVPSK